MTGKQRRPDRRAAHFLEAVIRRREMHQCKDKRAANQQSGQSQQPGLRRTLHRDALRRFRHVFGGALLSIQRLELEAIIALGQGQPNGIAPALPVIIFVELLAQPVYINAHRGIGEQVRSGLAEHIGSDFHFLWRLALERPVEQIVEQAMQHMRTAKTGRCADALGDTRQVFHVDTIRHSIAST